MKKLIPEKVEGYRSEAINGLIDCIVALWPVKSATLLTNVTVRGTSYEVKRPGSGGGGSMAFSGTAYIAGNKTTGLGTKAWVRCKLDLATAVDHDGPAPNPFPPNEEWYEVAQTPGDIHITRA
jgi:hypothetical protein